MREVGMRELKTRASAIVREIEEQHRRYVITRRGRPVAMLVPVEEPALLPRAEREGEDAWEELARLGAEIGEGWHAPQSSTELLSASRR